MKNTNIYSAGLYNALLQKAQKIAASGSMLYVFILFMLITETTAMGYLKDYSVSGHILALIVGIGFYFCMDLFLLQSLRFEGMGIVNTIASSFSVVLVVITGMILFGEKISGIQIMGIIFVLSGTIILRSSNAKSQRKSRGGRCIHLTTDDIPPRF